MAKNRLNHKTSSIMKHLMMR